jgi:hypothetical protein
MNELPFTLSRVVLIGIGATATMDLWLLLLRRLGVPTLNFAMIGRWVGHWRHGRWAHERIAGAAPVTGETALGWLVHYATGVAFAAVLVALCGPAWIASPSLLPALAMGVGSVAAPLLVMQPALGAGIASSRTATPLRNCLRSLANHTVFGIGLYLAALFFQGISQ